jgi:hypothetical protein
MGWIILIIVVLVAIGGIVGLVLYKSSQGRRSQSVARIYKAFQESQLVITHESKIDQDDLVEFVKALAEKDTLFKSDPQLLAFIEEYYKKCVDLNKKVERIRITQTKQDLELLMNEQKRMVEWFRQQDPVLRQMFARHL